MNQTGIDVSNDVFDVTLHDGNQLIRRQFANSASGHRRFISWAPRFAPETQVCMEATGVYHLQLALKLNRHPHFQLMLINPCAARRFVQAHMVRAKTDAIDADGLLLYLQRMPWRPWTAPKAEILQLQSLTRRMSQLDRELTRERCRLHAARRAGSHTTAVQEDIQAHVKQLQSRLAALKVQATNLIGNHQQLAEDANLIDSAPGFAKLSSTKLLAELAVLPDDMSPSQWVAHAGLDPRPRESGSSQNPPRRISKQGNVRLRAALFMPALVAVQHDPNVSAYYEKMLAKGKPKMVALTAVMRRLLHALWGMLHHRQKWDGDKFYRLRPAQ